MFDVLLGDDPAFWPWSAFINLPIIPFSLILSQFKPTSALPPFLPILLAMPNSLSVHRATAYWQLPENARKVFSTSAPSPPPGRTWPPTPILFGLFGVPMIQMLYRRLYSQVYLQVIGTLPPQDPLRARRGANRNVGDNNGRRGDGARMNIAEGPFGIRVRAQIRDEVRQPRVSERLPG